MAEELYRPWLWKVPDGGVIGKHVRLKDGYAKASGKGLYTRDIYRQGMLYAKFVLSPYTHAKIKSVDSTETRAIPGVWDVITFDDLDIKWFYYDAYTPTITPGTETPELKITRVSIDANGPVTDVYTNTDTANWNGQPMGVIVVAESEQVCDEALRRIKIEWEELPWSLDMEGVLEANAPVLFPELTPDSNLRRESEVAYGNIEKGFEEADKIIEFKLEHAEMSWAGTEGAVAVAEWKDDALEAWFHGQDPKLNAQHAIEKLTTLNKINIHTPLQGGTFGGITWMGVPETITMIAALAARRTGRPVKALYDQSHFHGFEEALGSYYFKVGFKKNGKVTAVQLHYIGPCIIGSAVGKLRAGTSIPNIQCTQTVPHHNRGPVGPQRAGAFECTVITAVFEHVAGELGIDPTRIAMINDGCEGNDMDWVNQNIKKVQGFDPTRDSLKEVMEAGKKAMDWDNKWHLPGTKILPNGKYHGLGCMWVEAWNNYWGSSEKIGLVMLRDGTVNILARGCENGTHRPTTYTQVVADETGLRYEDVNWKNSDDPGFDVAPLGSSSGMQRNIPPLARAARKMKQTILECATKPRIRFLGPLFPGKMPEELDVKNSEVFEKANPANKKPVALVAVFFPNELFVWDTSAINREKKYIMGRQAYFVEVEVDAETGVTEIKKVVVARDCGKVINPDSCDQQLYGVYQGLGRSNTEAIYRDPRTGVRLNDNLIDYPQYTMNDIEQIEINKIETGLGYGPYGLIGIGESAPCCTSTITGPAIYNAIGKYIDSFPTTPEKVLKALGKI